MDSQKLVALAKKAGWYTGHLDFKMTVDELTQHQRRLIGALVTGHGLGFGGRIPVLEDGVLAVQSRTYYESGYGYCGHECSLYLVPDGEVLRLLAWCFNWHFACPLGEKSREALLGEDLSSLPAVDFEMEAI